MLAKKFTKKGNTENYENENFEGENYEVTVYSNREKINIVSSFKIYTYIGSNDLNYRNYY